MSFYVVDARPNGQTQSNTIDEAAATAWLNNKSWQSCIGDQEVKDHVAMICPLKKGLLNETHDLPPALSPGDGVLLIQRDQYRHQATLRQPGKSSERASPWIYSVLSKK